MYTYFTCNINDKLHAKNGINDVFHINITIFLILCTERSRWQNVYKDLFIRSVPRSYSKRLKAAACYRVPQLGYRLGIIAVVAATDVNRNCTPRDNQLPTCGHGTRRSWLRAYPSTAAALSPAESWTPFPGNRCRRTHRPLLPRSRGRTRPCTGDNTVSRSPVPARHWVLKTRAKTDLTNVHGKNNWNDCRNNRINLLLKNRVYKFQFSKNR